LPASTLPQELNRPFSDPTAPDIAHDPGEFTRHFGLQSPGATVEQPTPLETAAPPPAPRRPANSSATGVFSAPQLAPKTPSLATPASGPGEYTRIFDRQPQPVEAETRPTTLEPVAAAPVRPAPQRSYVPLVLILSVLALAAFALIFYFLLRR
jgi:hypothetical protein